MHRPWQTGTDLASSSGQKQSLWLIIVWSRTFPAGSVSMLTEPLCFFRHRLATVHSAFSVRVSPAQISEARKDRRTNSSRQALPQLPVWSWQQVNTVRCTGWWTRPAASSSIITRSRSYMSISQPPRTSKRQANGTCVTGPTGHIANAMQVNRWCWCIRCKHKSQMSTWFSNT
jgi:hypothetical protein